MKALCVITGSLAVVMFLGTVGASDADVISCTQLAVRSAMELVVLGVSYLTYCWWDKKSA